MLVNIVAPFRMLLRFAIAINIIGNNLNHFRMILLHFRTFLHVFECFQTHSTDVVQVEISWYSKSYQHVVQNVAHNVVSICPRLKFNRHLPNKHAMY